VFSQTRKVAKTKKSHIKTSDRMGVESVKVITLKNDRVASVGFSARGKNHFDKRQFANWTREKFLNENLLPRLRFEETIVFYSSQGQTTLTSHILFGHM